MSDETFSTVVIPAECTGVRNDRFAGNRQLRWRNRAGGDGWLVAREVGVLYPDHHRMKTLVQLGEILYEVENAIGSLE